MSIADSHTLLATDEEIEAYLLDADLPSLLPTLACLTGDRGFIRSELRPPLSATAAAPRPQGGMSPEQQARARREALPVVRALAVADVQAPSPDAALLRDAMHFITGDVSDDYIPLLSQELGIEAPGTSAPKWVAPTGAPVPNAAIIGAGMSGILAARELREAGVPFVVFEKNPEVGGTWFENSYPGCRLDTNNFAYSYSFSQKADWPFQFSTRDAILDYFVESSEKFDIRKDIKFNTEVEHLEWDEQHSQWLVTAVREGSSQTLSFDIVVTATGQLNRPQFPDIPGRDSFAGPSWHTASWNHDVALRGLRVGVIGTGASAYQVVPSVVDEVGSLTVFQRTPPWMVPTPEYHSRVADGLQWLFAHLPLYASWYRFVQFWNSVEGRIPYVTVDPQWRGDDLSVSEKNAALLDILMANLRERYADRPDLLAKAVPSYPPGAKRMTRDNGVWSKALKADNTTLVTENIERITTDGVVTGDGQHHQLDVIIYATGFSASDFLTPMTVSGRGGKDLHEQWAGDARAYLGIHVPGFPNLFSIYGPNTALVMNGSTILFSEMAVHYILRCIQVLTESDSAALDVRQGPFEDFNREVDAANKRMAWGISGVNSWYKNRFGRVSQVWPFPIIEYWNATRDVRLADFELLGDKNG
jgi:4-hydroxyacetophenone monooxygenase